MKKIKILLVDDDPIDQRFIAKAFHHSMEKLELEVANDGAEALKCLDAGSRPTLIVTDLNMPRMDGRILLGHIKDNELLKKIPTIILTTSDTEQDMEVCYGRHANAYIVKPDSIRGYESLANTVRDFWMDTARIVA